MNGRIIRRNARHAPLQPDRDAWSGGREEHRGFEELEATIDWLAHIAAGRIQVR